MKVTLNGKEIGIQGEVSVLEFLKQRGLDPNKVVVEYNHDILEKKDWDIVILKENDKLEVLSFVGGG